MACSNFWLYLYLWLAVLLGFTSIGDLLKYWFNKARWLAPTYGLTYGNGLRLSLVVWLIDDWKRLAFSSGFDKDSLPWACSF
jgi:hypothetical protein